jgi:hypothetical protein
VERQRQVVSIISGHGRHRRDSIGGGGDRVEYGESHGGAAARRQGLTLVPFSAQPVPFLTQNTPLSTH